MESFQGRNECLVLRDACCSVHGIAPRPGSTKDLRSPLLGMKLVFKWRIFLTSARVVCFFVWLFLKRSVAQSWMHRGGAKGQKGKRPHLRKRTYDVHCVCCGRHLRNTMTSGCASIPKCCCYNLFFRWQRRETHSSYSKGNQTERSRRKSPQQLAREETRPPQPTVG